MSCISPSTFTHIKYTSYSTPLHVAPRVVRDFSTPGAVKHSLAVFIWVKCHWINVIDQVIMGSVSEGAKQYMLVGLSVIDSSSHHKASTSNYKLFHSRLLKSELR